MKKLIFLFMLLFMIAPVLAQTEVYYFYGVGCPHCANVADSGILEEVSQISGVELDKIEIYHDEEGRQKYLSFASALNLSNNQRGVPMAIVECEKKYSYMIGDKPIINEIKNLVESCESGSFIGESSSDNPHAEKITLGGLILAAVVDSINPCAFGVLIFLMISLLNMGSSKRALKAGLVYTFVVFVVYFFAGFGIFKAIQQFTSITHFVYIFSGVLVLVFGLWQFKDILFLKVGPTLQISPKVKPLIESIIQRGTIPAMILLGVLVSLFELPCTGGIYLGILTMMSINKTFGIPYLLLYNLIFVLPLIIIIFMIYKGTSPKILQRWNSSEKKWMKLGSGIVLIGLGLYILLF